MSKVVKIQNNFSGSLRIHFDDSECHSLFSLKFEAHQKIRILKSMDRQPYENQH